MDGRAHKVSHIEGGGMTCHGVDGWARKVWCVGIGGRVCQLSMQEWVSGHGKCRE